MDVIFLDIDGVLNSNLWNASHQKEIEEGTLIDKKWIVIDDLDLGNSTVSEHQIRTNPETGLTKQDVELVNKMIKG